MERRNQQERAEQMTHYTEAERAEQEHVDTTVFKRLLNDYADCLRNGDFQDAGAALLAVVVEYQQAARRAPVVPEGYALISKDVLRAWGKLEIVEQACSYPLAAAPQPPAAAPAQEGWCCGCGPNQEGEKE